MNWAKKYLGGFVLVATVFLTAPAWASPIACDYTAFLHELDRIEGCGSNFSSSGCQPANEHCASANTLDGGETATCCSGKDTGTCTAGRKITFNCFNAIIYVPNAPDNQDKFCDGGKDLSSPPCSDDSDCSNSTCDTNWVACPADGPWEVNSTQCDARNDPWDCCTGYGTGTCCTHEGSTDWFLDAHRRDIDYLIIDGQDNVTLQMDPPWWHRCDPTTNDAGNCNDVDDKAPNIELELSGDFNIVRDITFKNWIKALFFAGENDIADGVTVDNTWDFQIGVGRNADGTKQPKNVIINNSTFISSKDKCIETLNPGDAFSYPTLRATVTNSTFKSCRVGLSIKVGRWHIEGNRFEVNPAHYSKWNIHGAIHTSDASGQDPVLYLKNNIIDGSGPDPWDIGIHARSKGSIVSLGGNEIRNCEKVGIIAEDQAKVFLNNDIIENNGGDGDWYGQDGGIAITDSAVVECGGGSITIDGQTLTNDIGNNQFISNRDANGSPLDFRNTTSTTMTCRGNWWGDPFDQQVCPGCSPADLVYGPVDFDPWLSVPPQTNEDTTSPAAPSGLQIN